MTLTLPLDPELEKRLSDAANRLGVPPAECALRVLQEHLPRTDRAQAAVQILQSWLDEDDEGEQKETGDMLVRSLDEDRPANRKLFPPELEGVSW